MKAEGLSQEFREEFAYPGKEYRGTPFWSWNTKLKEGILAEQVKQFKDMGMGGFYICTRVGLDTEYLGSEYMKCIQKSVQLAKKNELYCCLYDEDRWPSGYGGGEVTKKQEFRLRNLLITPYKKGTKQYDGRNVDSMASPSPQGNGTFMAAYYVGLDPDGALAYYERCTEDAAEREGMLIWYVYRQIAHDSPWFNGQSYADTLNPEAVRYFLKLTYETYKAAVGEEFGKTIPSIFTDEPQFGRKHCLGTAWSLMDVMLPYTDDFPKTYYLKYGTDFFASVPELLWELPGGKISENRYRYHDHITERFAESYSKQVGEWCEKNGLKLAGHMMEEPTLQSQTQALGEVMRSLRGFSLPGIDMLCDAREYTTAKQAQSVTHQYGKAGNVSELYGVTNWDFDFRGHKLQGDWQSALGVTHRVHHLNWMSMGGEAKRDYPAPIGFQSPWYREYGIIETHFARVQTALRRGNPVVRIGVIHPVESCWVLYGPNRQTGDRRQELEERFQSVTEWLLFGTLDFDYIAESLIPELWDGRRLGKMEYDAVVVPGCLTLRKTTVQMLRELRRQGKCVIFMGEVPSFMDARKSEEIQWLAQDCSCIEFSRTQLLKQLEPFREIELRFQGEKHLKKPNHKKNWDGERTERYLYQMREEGTHRWLFIANGKKVENPDLVLKDELRIEIKGEWSITEMDTMTGEIRQVNGTAAQGKTVFQHSFYAHDSLLLYLEPGRGQEQDAGNGGQSREAYEKNLFDVSVNIVREEPNVLILDMPSYQLENRIAEPEEILRADNEIRKRLGYPLRMAALAQPWTRHVQEHPHELWLRYEIFCKDKIKKPFLAMEAMEAAHLYLDGGELERSTGTEDYYVDPCIRRTVLPDLEQGKHELVMKFAYTSKINLEACYILGDFDVEICGAKAVLKKKRREYGWNSLTEQGMPFYGGNVTYQAELALEKGTYEIEVTKYRAPLIKVYFDHQECGTIIGSPYRVSIKAEEDGIHRLELKCFGNRVNTFGAIHDCDEREVYFDPNAWRTTGDSWSYEYQLKRTGILKAPIIRRQ